MSEKIVKNGDFKGFISNQTLIYADNNVANKTYNTLFPNWTFSDIRSSNGVLHKGNGGFDPNLDTSEQCIVFQQGSNASITVSQNINFKESGNYTLTFKTKHRNRNGNGNLYYDPRQRIFVTMFNDSEIVLPEVDCSPKFTGEVDNWDPKKYNFNILGTENFTLSFTVKMPSTNTPGTALFLKNVEITKSTDEPVPTVQCGFVGVGGYERNLTSSTTQQCMVVNDTNSYSMVFSDILKNTTNNPISDYFSFNARAK